MNFLMPFQHLVTSSVPSNYPDPCNAFVNKIIPTVTVHLVKTLHSHYHLTNLTIMLWTCFLVPVFPEAASTTSHHPG